MKFLKHFLKTTLTSEVSFAEGLGYGVQLNPSHQNASPHPPLLREDGCMQGRERVGRIVAVLILDLSVPISPLRKDHFLAREANSVKLTVALKH